MSQRDRGGRDRFFAPRHRSRSKARRAQGRNAPKARVKLGADEGPAFSLDLAFGGGLPTGALYEIVPARASDMAAATGFALALAARLSRARAGAIVWIGQDFLGSEFATPYGPGLAAHGLDPARLILVNVATTRDLVWAMEEALKCPACAAVIGEFWSSRPQAELVASLRLLRAARSSAASGLLLLHQDIDFTCQIFSRLEIGTGSGAAHRQAVANRCRPVPSGRSKCSRHRLWRGDRAVSTPTSSARSSGTRREPSLVMRYLSLWLENWGIEAGLGRRTPDVSRPARPLAAYARAGNVHRLVAVNAAARRLGLTPGLTLAEARARHPSLEALQHDPAAATERLAALTAWCRRFTPLSACDAPDGIILDITGAAHLFGGEERLIAEIETRLAAQGLTAIAAIAGTPEAAWALARFSPHKIAAAAADAKRLARLVDPLPLAALRLDRQTLAALAQSGLGVSAILR